MSDRTRWSRVENICETALTRSVADRHAFVITACGGDETLRLEVESLLAQDAKSSRFLNATALETVARSLATASHQTLVGQQLGPYEIQALVGAGGMGEVYRARDRRLLRDVAVKVLPATFNNDPERLRRFEHEAHAAAALNHSNILALYDIGSHDGAPYIVSEFLEGETLSERLAREPLTPNAAADIAVQLAQGVAAAHEAGIVHRDLKPANIFVTNHDQVKVLDFGLAKMSAPPTPVLDGASASARDFVTARGEVFGTVAYMSPEQAAGMPVDARSDVWSLGVVFYQMISGHLPFQGEHPAMVAAAILNTTPNPPCSLRAEMPKEFDRIVLRALAKNPDDRYQSAADLIPALKRVRHALADQPTRLSRVLRQLAVGSSVAIVIGGAIASGWLWHRSGRERWAREVAIPEVSRLVDAGEFSKAADLIQEARRVLPKDPTLENLWMRSTEPMSIASVPPDADVSIRSYLGDPNHWDALGRTPIKSIRIVKSVHVYRVAKAGFAPAFIIGGHPAVGQPGLRYSPFPTLRLRPLEHVPAEMVVVPGATVGLEFPFGSAPSTRVDDFLVDRHEVTNEDYKKFVDAGGYQRREFWKPPFERDRRTVSFDEAVLGFHDTTGRPGPATWEFGTYPTGRAHHPVAGISWYEAAAYAEFAGKSLPTAYHWTRASQAAGLAGVIASGSNFRGAGTVDVGAPTAESGFGTTDMAGNVKEWCLNEGRDGKRFILGGGFGDPPYMFDFGDEQSPWDRRPDFGVRCVRLDSPPLAAASGRIAVSSRDYWNDRPVSDDLFSAYKGLYAYDRSELSARIEDKQTTNDWVREKVTFNAAYGTKGAERVVAQVFVPGNAKPPFQVVVYFPGGFALLDETLTPAAITDPLDFILKSGRALIVPIYKGTYERRDGIVPGDKPTVWRDHVLMWSKDVGRSIDYLETRPDVDRARIAFLGSSMGAKLGPIFLTVEPRLKTAILSSGGFDLRYDQPEATPFNFITHVRAPVLMLNGRFDDNFPLESSQRPFFHYLGTPDVDKKHLIYETTHGNLPHQAEVRETLSWLDKYLGLVNR